MYAFQSIASCRKQADPLSVQRSMYSCVSLLLLAGNLSREHMIRITIVRLVGKVHFRSDYDMLGHDKAFFPKIRFIITGGVCDC